VNGLDVLLTGFGAFEQVSDNPSGFLARELDGQALSGGRVVGALLPVSFERGPQELERLVERVRPIAILAMGVHPGDGFRIERGAGVILAPDRPDVDGVTAQDLPGRTGSRISTGLDIVRLGQVLDAAADAEVRISDDAGGYVCESVYRRALEIGEATRTPCLFLHVPPFERLSRDQQRSAVLALLGELSDQVGGPREGAE